MSSLCCTRRYVRNIGRTIWCSDSRKADSNWCSQEISRLLRGPEEHCHTRKSQPAVPVWSQTNTANFAPKFWISIKYFRFSYQHFMRILHISNSCYVPYPCYSPWFCNRNKVGVTYYSLCSFLLKLKTYKVITEWLYTFKLIQKISATYINW